MPVPEPFLARGVFPAAVIAVISVAEIGVLFHARIIQPVYRFSGPRRLRRISEAASRAGRAPAELKILIETVRRGREVIIHLSRRKRRVLEIRAPPERRSVTAEDNRVPLIENTVRRHVLAVVIPDFYGNLEQLRRKNIRRAADHVGKGIRRCPVQAELVHGDAVDLLLPSLGRKRVADFRKAYRSEEHTLNSS